MAIRNQQSINTIVDKAKGNMFLREQEYGANLFLGVSKSPNMFLQSNLIFAASSDYSTLAQKNTFVDIIGKYRYDLTKPDGYVGQGYVVGGYVD